MRVFGFVLYGLRDPYTPSGVNAQKPVLFTDTGIDPAQLPAEFSGYKILAILPPGNDPGEGWVGDPRGDLGQGGQQSIDIPEDTLGSFAKLLLPDPKAQSWFLKSAMILEDTVGNITVRVNGESGAVKAPQVNAIYWIEQEAFYTVSVLPVSFATGQAMSYQLVLTRARCGSFQERHEIDPAAYGDGTGLDVKLLLESKPNFEAHRFKGAFFMWRLPTNRGAVAVEVERRNFFIDAPPELVEEEGKFFYRVTPRSIADVVKEHRFSLTPKEVANETRIQVVELEEVSTAAGYIARPKKARVALSRLKTELLFRHAVHSPSSGALSVSLLADLWTRIQACRPFVDHRIVVRSMGTWIFKISNIESVGIFAFTKKAAVDLDLISYEPGSTLATAHPSGGPPPQGTSSTNPTDPVSPFESGWAWYLSTNVQPEEEPPTLELRWVFECSPITACLILLLSRGGATTGFYDRMIGRPLALPLSWVNLGAEVADPTTVDPRTKELLQLNQILNEYTGPQFQNSDTVGAFFRDINLFYLLLFTSLSTGKITLRRWATSIAEGLPAINPLKRSLDVGQLLEPLRAVRLLSGINDVDLEPQFGRTVTLGGAKTVEAIVEAVSLRIWQPGNVLGDDALKSEAFSVFFRALFSVLGGQPRMYQVETSLEVQQFDPGDVVQWSDKRLPTPEGIGFANVRFLVVGKDVNFQESTATYRLLRDYYNETSTTLGRVAPCLLIDQVIRRSGNVFTVDVISVGDQDFDVAVSYDEIYNEFIADTARLRIFYPLLHNPASVDEEERPGYLEGSASLTAIDSLDFRGRINRLTLTVSALWARGNTLYDIIRRGARIYFSDRREDDQNAEGVLIEPHYLQLYADGTGFDYAKWGATPTFDANYTLISDVP